MHIETLRKHRKNLIKARRDIKAKLELLDTLLEEHKREASLQPPSGVFEPTAATDADDIVDDMVYREPTVAEWDAAKAYQTAARNAFRNATTPDASS